MNSQNPILESLLVFLTTSLLVRLVLSLLVDDEFDDLKDEDLQDDSEGIIINKCS